MSKTIALFSLISISLFAADTSIPKKIGGVLVLSPTELQSLQVTISPERKCETSVHTTFESTKCELSGTVATFETKGEKNIVKLDRLLEFYYPNAAEGNADHTYALMGNWTGSLNGYEVQSRILINLVEVVGKARKYTGFVEFQDYGVNRIPLDAKAE